jgi:hypothetical protein
LIQITTHEAEIIGRAVCGDIPFTDPAAVAEEINTKIREGKFRTLYIDESDSRTVIISRLSVMIALGALDW